MHSSSSSESATRSRRARPRDSSARAAVKHLLDRLVEPLEITPHPVEELVAALALRVVALQGVQVEPQRGERRLHLVGHGVQKGALVLVDADLPHQPGAQPHQADDDQHEADRAQDEEDPIEIRQPALDGARAAPHQDLPADGERQDQNQQDDARA